MYNSKEERNTVVVAEVSLGRRIDHLQLSICRSFTFQPDAVEVVAVIHLEVIKMETASWGNFQNCRLSCIGKRMFRNERRHRTFVSDIHVLMFSLRKHRKGW